MNAKKRLIRNIIVSVLAVGILAGVLIAVMNMDSKEETQDTPAATQTPSYNAYTVEKDNIQSIAVNNAGSVLTVVNSDGKWQIDGYGADDADSIRVENLVTTVSTVISNNEVEKNPSDLTQYGLDNPELTVEINKKDGSKDRLIIGDVSPVTGEYFFMTEGSDTIYTIYSYKVDTLKQPISYYRIFNRFSIDTTKMSEIILERKEQSDIHLKVKDSTDDSYNVWTMLKPYQGEVMAIDQYVDDKILMPVSELQINAPAEDGKNYGFDDPKAVVTFITADYNDNNEITSTEKQKLVIGNTENHITYVKLNDLDTVFAVSDDLLSFAFVDEFLVVSKLQGMADIAKTSKMEVTAAAGTYTMDIEHLPENKFAFKINGKEADEKKSKQTYQSVIALNVDGVYKNETLADAEITVKFTGYDTNPDITVEYIPINELSYAVRRNGVVQFTIKKLTVEKALNTLYEYEQNPTA